MAIWLGVGDLYARLASGDPDTVKRFAPRVAVLTAAARACTPKPSALGSGSRQASPRPRSPSSSHAASATPPALPSSPRDTPVPAYPSAPASSSSRAAQIAEIHLGPINASRKRCGLAPLEAAEFARKFADIDRLPQRMRLDRRAAANIAARHQGVPMAQTGIDDMWAALATKLNATLPARAPPDPRLTSPPSSAARAPQGQFEVDGIWGSIASGLNAEARFKTPSRSRVR